MFGTFDGRCVRNASLCMKCMGSVRPPCVICVVFALIPQQDVMDLVELMGGRVYRDLNVSVTHLVAGEVGSKKYLVAASLGKPILLPSWVKVCWEKCQDR